MCNDTAKEFRAQTQAMRGSIEQLRMNADLEPDQSDSHLAAWLIGEGWTKNIGIVRTYDPARFCDACIVNSPRSCAEHGATTQTGGTP